MEPNAATLAQLIRDLVPNPQSDPAMRMQMLRLARENLHLPGIAEALVACLADTQDVTIRRTLAELVGGLDTSRFNNLSALHAALLKTLEHETDRQVRVALLERLGAGFSQDETLVPFFLGFLAKAELTEAERGAALQAVSSLPYVQDATALQALQACVLAPAWLQGQALRLAVALPSWSAALVEALRPYVRREVSAPLRALVLDKLKEGRRLTPEYVPILQEILSTSTDPGERQEALEHLGSIRPWTDSMITTVLNAAANDTDQGVRAQAARLQTDLAQLDNDQMVRLAESLEKEVSAGVRATIMSVLQTSLRHLPVRQAVARVFAGHPGLFDDREFSQMLSLLGPYVGRDQEIRQILVKALPGNPRSGQRAAMVTLVSPYLEAAEAAALLIPLLRQERDPGVRQVVFARLKPLSIARYPELVTLYMEEATEPSSPFRLECTRIIAGCVEEHPEAVAALEDILRFDQDRELVRLSLEGYLKPGVKRSFAPLLAVVRNEQLDLGSRQKALAELIRVGVTPEEQEQIRQALAAAKPGTLQSPSA